MFWAEHPPSALLMLTYYGWLIILRCNDVLSIAGFKFYFYETHTILKVFEGARNSPKGIKT